MRFLLSLTVALALVQPAFARDKERPFKKGRSHFRGNERSERVSQLTVGQPVYNGNGCPQGTMAIAFAPDNLSFSLLFNSFIAEAQGGGRGQRRDIMTCNALIPIQIPPGMQMEITRVDYRGFVAIPAGARGVLHSVFNFRGRGGDGDRMNLLFRFDGPVMDNYEITTDVMSNGNAPNTEVSPCGGQTVLRIMNEVRVNTRKSGEPATITVDSIDGAANAVYYVNYRKCR